MTWVLYVAGRPVARGTGAGDPGQLAVDVLSARTAGAHPRQLDAQVEVTVGGIVVAAADSRDW